MRFVGPVSGDGRSAFLGGARTLLHLIDFDEPFGFSVVEAMAFGTPVIAFDRGSMRELVDDGSSGRLAADIGGAVTAVSEVATYDRAAIRQRAVARFGVDRMVDRYLSVYEAAIADGCAIGARRGA